MYLLLLSQKIDYYEPCLFASSHLVYSLLMGVVKFCGRIFLYLLIYLLIVLLFKLKLSQATCHSTIPIMHNGLLCMHYINVALVVANHKLIVQIQKDQKTKRNMCTRNIHHDYLHVQSKDEKFYEQKVTHFYEGKWQQKHNKKKACGYRITLIANLKHVHYVPIKLTVNIDRIVIVFIIFVIGIEWLETNSWERKNMHTKLLSSNRNQLVVKLMHSKQGINRY